jgi:hypothetical protein
MLRKREIILKKKMNKTRPAVRGNDNSRFRFPFIENFLIIKE